MRRTWLDRAIGWASPQSELRRAHARMAIEHLEQFAYEGARAGRRTDGWLTSGTSADAEILTDLSRLRSRSRDLVRNNPYAAKAVRTITSHTIGTGIVAEASDEKSQQVWDRFTAYCDADGHLDFYGLQKLAARTIVESGSVLIRLRPRAPRDGFEVPLQLQVLEPDYIDATKNSEATGSGFIRAGVEYDGIGRTVAYWMFQQHPGETGIATMRMKSLVSVRVPAANVLHVFEKLRPGQSLGVPWFAPVMLTMRDLDELDDARIVGEKLRACLTAVITSPDAQSDPLGSGATTDTAGRRIEGFSPGMFRYTKPGEAVEFLDPKPGEAGSYRKERLQSIGAGVGVPYQNLTGDLADANYSNQRAGRLDFKAVVEEFRWLTLVPAFFDPVYRRFQQVAFAAGVVDEQFASVSWTPPRWEQVDPLKDSLAEQLDVRNGFEVLGEIMRRRGYSPAKQLEAMAAFNKRLDDLGIVLDSDPRKVSKGGIAQASDPVADDGEAGAVAQQSLIRQAIEDAVGDSHEATRIERDAAGRALRIVRERVTPLESRRVERAASGQVTGTIREAADA